MDSGNTESSPDSATAEKLEPSLKLTEDEFKNKNLSEKAGGGGDSGACNNGNDVEDPQAPRTGDTKEEESFFDCKESLEEEEQRISDKEKNNIELKEQQEVEFDEEYLMELEKDMPEEEKQRRRDESSQLKEEGNDQFKKGEYTAAETSYMKALEVCPFCFQKDRSILYSNRAAARMKMDKKEDAISDCTKAIKLNPNYIRAILRRAELYEKTDKLDEALEDYKTVIEKDPSVHQAREACMRLPRQIEERNERLKEEMMSKLKDLGNMILRPFGLSTRNFQVNQDPSSGSYSINFVQSPNNNNR
ncbi:tetratricopeptide repeat protein 1 [Latimeria chalumnae]|uniref:tetratricopeptide repeat protein 1 n=1 Tax=Latimeria chalumnae TaxID=7897 RepID=UPI0006D929D2|nr:PREDICTED: tetratricopeptide repeat protein 1 [Latimeria chalumnae]|eukprot:XP_014347907.1 PREDICTED: tetratricopeptide repeat protein 1 [Latimeria chalumnae]